MKKNLIEKRMGAMREKIEGTVTDGAPTNLPRTKNEKKRTRVTNPKGGDIDNVPAKTNPKGVTNNPAVEGKRKSEKMKEEKESKKTKKQLEEGTGSNIRVIHKVIKQSRSMIESNIEKIQKNTVKSVEKALRGEISDESIASLTDAIEGAFDKIKDDVEDNFRDGPLGNPSGFLSAHERAASKRLASRGMSRLKNMD